MRSVRYACLGLLLSSAALAQTSADATVRVRLLSRQSLTEARVEPVSGSARVRVDGSDAGWLSVGETATVTRTGSGLRVRFGGADQTGRTVRVEGETLRFRSASTDRHYPGTLAFGASGSHLEIVNHAPMEPYVASVVQSEFGFDVLEGAKAQAVLARTYAARRAGAHATYDLDDHNGSQVYRGVGATSATSTRAAMETRGEVLTYHGELADAYYYSSSGGHTADNDAVWNGAPIPYLRAVPDPYDEVAPDFRWRTTASRQTVLSALQRQYGGDIQGVEVLRRSRSNRILTMRLIGGRTETITGAQFRRTVNSVAGARVVRSTRFDLSVEGGNYVFEGSGFGHGVGMSQYGALGQARAGRTYRDILAHYFVGTEVRSGSGASPLPSAARPSPSSPEVLADASSGAAIPRQPSALRTRYVPATARRWPTPRHIAHGSGERERPAIDGRPSTPAASAVPSAASSPVTETEESVTPQRRAAW